MLHDVCGVVVKHVVRSRRHLMLPIPHNMLVHFPESRGIFLELVVRQRRLEGAHATRYVFKQIFRLVKLLGEVFLSF